MISNQQTLLFIPTVAETVMQGDVRLQGGAVDSEGRVEIYSDEEGWGTVCNENWDQSDGDVVCSQLGYDNASAVKSFGPGSGAILLSGLDCVGNETNLFKCPWFSRKRCIHEDDAGVVCERKHHTTPHMYKYTVHI